MERKEKGEKIKRELLTVNAQVDNLKDKLKEKTGEFPSFAEGIDPSIFELISTDRKKVENLKFEQSVSPVQTEGDIKSPSVTNKESINRNNKQLVQIQLDKEIERKRVHHSKRETLGTLKTTDRLKEVL